MCSVQRLARRYEQRQEPLFPAPEQVDPPARCPGCGAPVTRMNFTWARCSHECGWEWRRSGQLHPGEDLPF